MSSKLGLNAAGKRNLAPPSPSPSTASNASHSTPSAKRVKRDLSSKPAAGPTPAELAAQETNYGEDMRTQLSYAVQYLKEKQGAKTLHDVLSHLSRHHMPDDKKFLFAKYMQNHSQIECYKDAKRADWWQTAKFEFRAKIPGVTTKETLLQYLQHKTDASRLDVKDLKDGWPDCDKAIDELERAHRLLVVRTKKDGHAKFVWIDNPELFHPVDPEFRAMWARVELPSLDDIVRKLSAVGQKPASADPRLLKKDAPKLEKKRRKANRANKRQTNMHMQHLLKDYSGLRK